MDVCCHKNMASGSDREFKITLRDIAKKKLTLDGYESLRGRQEVILNFHDGVSRYPRRRFRCFMHIYQNNSAD